MRLLIFENEFVYLDTAFRYVNQLHFDNSLQYDVFASSQDFNDFSNIMSYDKIFVDISLSKKSVLDGFGILKKLSELNYPKSQIIIMTGNHQIKEGLAEKGIDTDYTILTKPVDIKDLISVL